MTNEDALRTLIDKDAIRELGMLYSRAIDRKDVALLRSLYTHDATDTHGDSYDGAAAGYCDFIARSLPYVRYSGHHICNHLIAVDGDRGDGEIYAVAVHVIPDGAGGWTEDIIWVRYIDNYRRVDGRWRFAKRIVTTIIARAARRRSMTARSPTAAATRAMPRSVARCSRVAPPLTGRPDECAARSDPRWRGFHRRDGKPAGADRHDADRRTDLRLPPAAHRTRQPRRNRRRSLRQQEQRLGRGADAGTLRGGAADRRSRQQTGALHRLGQLHRLPEGAERARGALGDALEKRAEAYPATATVQRMREMSAFFTSVRRTMDAAIVAATRG